MACCVTWVRDNHVMCVISIGDIEIDTHRHVGLLGKKRALEWREGWVRGGRIGGIVHLRSPCTQLARTRNVRIHPTRKFLTRDCKYAQVYLPARTRG